MNIKDVFVNFFCYRGFGEEIVMKIIVCLNFFFLWLCLCYEIFCNNSVEMNKYM